MLWNIIQYWAWKNTYLWKLEANLIFSLTKSLQIVYWILTSAVGLQIFTHIKGLQLPKLQVISLLIKRQQKKNNPDANSFFKFCILFCLCIGPTYYYSIYSFSWFNVHNCYKKKSRNLCYNLETNVSCDLSLRNQSCLRIESSLQDFNHQCNFWFQIFFVL